MVVEIGRKLSKIKRPPTTSTPGALIRRKSDPKKPNVLPNDWGTKIDPGMTAIIQRQLFKLSPGS